jgi:hypothetical protein
MHSQYLFVFMNTAGAYKLEPLSLASLSSLMLCNTKHRLYTNLLGPFVSYKDNEV